MPGLRWLGGRLVRCRTRGARLTSGLAASAVLLMSAVPTVAMADQPTDYRSVLAALSREIPKEMDASHTVGLSIALVDGDRTVLARGFGWADRAAGAPVTADTLFHIGSTSKPMAAAAVMQLVEQGRVDLDAPLSRYVPEFSLLPRLREARRRAGASCRPRRCRR
jgi:CubicO group peptidase (beta-lactamase class C family)